MQMRKQPLVNHHYYHIYSRSIAGFKIFNNPDDYNRMHAIIRLFQYTDFIFKYSRFIDLELLTQIEIHDRLKSDSSKWADIVAYCLMPTHIHLILKQETNDGVSKYMSKLLNSYTRYFNTTHKRSGPLWTGRFKSVLVDKDNQLIHLTRYIHLNPVSAGLVNEPEEWDYSSYNEYIGRLENSETICNYKSVIEIAPDDYIKSVQNRKDYQKELSHIKKLLIDHYTG